MPRLPPRACRPLEPAYSQTRESSLWHMSWCLALVAKGLLSVGLVGFSIAYGQAPGQEQVSVESTGTPRSLPEPPFPSSPCGPGAAGQQAPQSLSLGQLVCSGRTLDLKGPWGEALLSDHYIRPLLGRQSLW